MTVPDVPRRYEPAFNLPGSVSGMLAVMAIIHAIRGYVLSPEQDDWVIATFAFVPARYDFAGDWGPKLWTPISYGLLHGDWTHYLVNAVWLAAFGSALAWRFGPLRFLAFSIASSIASAGMFQAFHMHEFVPVVGASGAISGHMAATARFMFEAGGPLAARRGDPRVFVTPAAPLGKVLTDVRVLAFLGLWLAMNLVFGVGIVTLTGETSQIAWEAHLGGFLFGFFAFSLFDPVGRGPAGRRPPSPDAMMRPMESICRLAAQSIYVNHSL